MPLTLQHLLHFTLLESLPALTVVFVAFDVNLLWLWVVAPDSVDPTPFVSNFATGYGFWAFFWGFAAHVVAECRELDTRRRFARLAALVYVCWWPAWWRALLASQLWCWYVVLLYVPVRGAQALGFVYAALAMSDEQLAHPDCRRPASSGERKVRR